MLATRRLAAVLATTYAGLDDEAAAAFAETKRLQPEISLNWACAHAPLSDRRDLNRYVEGLRRAGIA